MTYTQLHALFLRYNELMYKSCNLPPEQWGEIAWTVSRIRYIRDLVGEYRYLKCRNRLP